MLCAHLFHYLLERVALFNVHMGDLGPKSIPVSWSCPFLRWHISRLATGTASCRCRGAWVHMLLRLHARLCDVMLQNKIFAPSYTAYNNDITRYRPAGCRGGVASTRMTYRAERKRHRTRVKISPQSTARQLPFNLWSSIIHTDQPQQHPCGTI